MSSAPVRMERMLGALLRIPSQAIVTRIAGAMHQAGYHDLSSAQFNVFQHLPAEGARVTELAERAQITKQSMSARVNELVDGGYLYRTPDPADGRASIVLRTERGWEIERIARATINEIEREWAEALGEERFREFRSVLEDLARLLES